MNKFLLIAVMIAATALVLHHQQAPAQSYVANAVQADAATDDDTADDDDDCFGDCAASEAGYHWAQKNAVTDENTCDTAANKSTPFVEGCKAFANEDNSAGKGRRHARRRYAR